MAWYPGPRASIPAQPLPPGRHGSPGRTGRSRALQDRALEVQWAEHASGGGGQYMGIDHGGRHVRMT